MDKITVHKSSITKIYFLGNRLEANITTLSVLGLQDDGETKFRMQNPIDTLLNISIVERHLSIVTWFEYFQVHVFYSRSSALAKECEKQFNESARKLMQWKHIQEILETDLKRGELRFFPKLKSSMPIQILGKK